MRQDGGRRGFIHAGLGASLSLALSGCAWGPRGDAAADDGAPFPGRTAWALGARGVPGAHWSHYTLPGKQPTQYADVHLDGRSAMLAEADASASMLRAQLRVEPLALGRLRFSWRVDKLIAGADMAARESDDSPVRVVLAFDGDRSTFSTRNAALSELARALTGEALPYATLMYVWSNQQPPGSLIVNARTDRIRKLVLEQGPSQLGRWRDYVRDIPADYQRAFGDAPGALVGIGVMTDADNTRSTARAWYGPIELVPPGGSAA